MKNMKNHPMNQAPRCGAKTRRGTPCQAPAMVGKRRCRLHAGKASGAPTRNVRACRGMDLFEVARAVGPLVAGGWLEPESPYGGNKAWRVNDAVFVTFVTKSAEEAERRRASLELIRRCQGHQGVEKRDNLDCARVDKKHKPPFSSSKPTSLQNTNSVTFVTVPTQAENPPGPRQQPVDSGEVVQ
ncbi:HGGxSTG domain-containing protein [Magnetospira sp. QH-2]|uniref:HGGxSTG domain-containing protein n=1 Tax=Magnetospira sp. (strain QH-2) TaxID=1288970 RepID=UPI0003E817D8|nr:HGGxSTG domain-containing protein [Magnetospira sp. QH-2]CCQ72422.1 protein of unknown function [Magnetospira sp. QH-2]